MGINDNSLIKKMLKTSTYLSILIMLFKIIGFLKQAVMANYYGASLDMDLYSMSSSFVRGIASVFIDALSIAMVSSYTYLLTNHGRKKANELLSNLFLVLITFTFFLIIIFIGLSSQIAKYLGHKYSTDIIVKLALDIKLVTPYIIFSAFAIICTSALDAEKKFFAPRFESIINSIVVIFFTVLFSKDFGVNVLFVSDIISVLIFCIFLQFKMRKNFTFILSNPFQNSYIITIIKNALPLLLGNATYRLNTIVDSILASSFEGGPASLSYSHVLEQFITITLATSIGNTLFSYLANFIAEKKQSMISDTLTQTIRLTYIIIVPLTIITIFLAPNIVKIIYFRGSFTENAVTLTSAALIGYAIGFPFTVIKDLLIKCMYAYGNTRTPTLIGSISILLNIVLSITLSHYLGLFGITIATSMASVVGFFLVSFYINTHYVKFVDRHTLYDLFKALIAGIVMALGIILIKNLISTDFTCIMVATIGGGSIYLCLLYLFKINEIQKLLLFIKLNIKNNRR